MSLGLPSAGFMEDLEIPDEVKIDSVLPPEGPNFSLTTFHKEDLDLCSVEHQRPDTVPFASDLWKIVQDITRAGFNVISLYEILYPGSFEPSKPFPDAGFLYHGTTQAVSEDLRSGRTKLSTSMSRRGLFGKAIYLTPSIKKAMNYSQINEGGVQYLVVCKVKTCSTLVYPPGLTDPHNTFLRDHHDSASGFVKDGRELAVYNDKDVQIIAVVEIAISGFLTFD